MIRRYLEPLEWDCTLHTDAEVAREHGHGGVTAPFTAIWSFLLPALWMPGEVLYADDRLDTQPLIDRTYSETFPDAPKTRAMLGTDISLSFDRAVIVGERVGAAPRRLIACSPKETRSGRGAFISFDREIIVESGERVCTISSQLYLFDPWDVDMEDRSS